jgi:hypothetical protein
MSREVRSEDHWQERISISTQVVARYAVNNSQQSTMPTSNFIDIFSLRRCFRFRAPIAVQSIHARKPSVKPPNAYQELYSPNTIAFGRHSNSLPSSLRGFQELPQLLFENLQPLRTGCVRHSEHRTPQVERVGDICASAE